ncbi:MAG TPA: nitroreductase family protein [Dehalococcoidia bacterium]|nr:nitroreductase family protein [Dehalococcoidia bacterium]
MEFFEVIDTQRAMRRLKPDPVPDELIWKLLDAAVKAPSGGNRQPWNFIVIRDAETKAKIAEWYLDGWNTAYGPFRQAAMASPAIARTYSSADRLANHLAEVPVLIMVTLDPARVAPVTPPGANVFPAVQNLLLAARALGLGATLTTVYRTHEAEVKKLLGIPENVETMALIPIGYPVGKFGPPGMRMPAETVTYWEKWGAAAAR